MTKRVTRKYVIESYKVLKVGYCALQTLLAYETPQYYTAGVYGWNADVYVFGDVAICTGYRPFGVAAIDARLAEDHAIRIMREKNMTSTERKQAIGELLNKFLDYNRKYVLCGGDV